MKHFVLEGRDDGRGDEQLSRFLIKLVYGLIFFLLLQISLKNTLVYHKVLINFPTMSVFILKVVVSFVALVSISGRSMVTMQVSSLIVLKELVNQCDSVAHSCVLVSSGQQKILCFFFCFDLFMGFMDNNNNRVCPQHHCWHPAK